MDFNLSEEQSLLRDSIARYLQDKYDFDARREITASDLGYSPLHWQAFAHELGILGAAFPATLGGFGGGAVENMIVMEEMGKAIAVEPYFSTIVLGGGFLKHSQSPIAHDVIGKIIAGEAILACAYAEPQGRYDWADVKTSARKDGGSYIVNGHKAVVVAAPYASHLVVTARTGGGQRDRNGLAVLLVDRKTPGIATRDYPTVDGFRAAEVYFENVVVPADNLLNPDSSGIDLIEQVMDEAMAAVCAEAVGCMRKLHSGTIDYTRQRKQFGVPIASFQVLQHAMVDMFLALEQAVSMTMMATLKLDSPSLERARALSAAKVQVGKSCNFVGKNAIQIHGGIGMTNELAIGHYFKRTTMIENLFGSVDHHLARFERLSRTA